MHCALYELDASGYTGMNARLMHALFCIIVQLFDYIACCIENFIEINEMLPNDGTEAAGPIPLGFTFSFPCRQEGLTIARLVVWTKGFSCPGVEGQNVVQLLQSAIQRRKVATIITVSSSSA